MEIVTLADEISKEPEGQIAETLSNAFLGLSGKRSWGCSPDDEGFALAYFSVHPKDGWTEETANFCRLAARAYWNEAIRAGKEPNDFLDDLKLDQEPSLSYEVYLEVLSRIVRKILDLKGAVG